MKASSDAGLFSSLDSRVACRASKPLDQEDQMVVRNDDSLKERTPDTAATQPQSPEAGNPEGAGYTGGTQEKKRPMPESV